MAGLGEEAAAEAVGTDPESRADDAVELLRHNAERAGYEMAEATVTQARADYPR